MSAYTSAPLSENNVDYSYHSLPGGDIDDPIHDMIKNERKGTSHELLDVSADFRESSVRSSFYIEDKNIPNKKKKSKNDDKKKRSWCTICLVLTLVVLVAAIVAYFAFAIPLVENIIANTELKLNTTTLTMPRTTAVGFHGQGYIVSDVMFFAIMQPSMLTMEYEGKPFAILSTEALPINPADTTVNGIRFSLDGDLSITDPMVFDEFSVEMAQGFEFSISLSGNIDVTVLYVLPFFDIPFAQEMSFYGMNGLSAGSVDYFQTRMQGTMLMADIDASTDNPSSFIIDPVGTLDMAVSVDDWWVMQATVRDLTLNQGEVHLAVTARLDPGLINNANMGAVKLLTNFIHGRETLVVATDISSSNELYNTAMGTMTLPLTFPGTPDSLLVASLATFNYLSLAAQFLIPFMPVNVPLNLLLQSPLATEVVVTRLNIKVTYSGSEVMSINTMTFADGSPLQMVLPGGMLWWSDQVNGRVNTAISSMFSLIDLFFSTLSAGVVLVDAVGELDVLIGDVALTLPYEASNVPVCPSHDFPECRQ
jgi:hypothetical protein